MTDTKITDQDLDVLFADARDMSIQPSAELTDAVMASAIATLENAQPLHPRASVSLWQKMLDTLGGWPAMGGLATAAVMGVWVGISPPASLDGIVPAIGVQEASFDFWGSMLTDELGEG